MADGELSQLANLSAALGSQRDGVNPGWGSQAQAFGQPAQPRPPVQFGQSDFRPGQSDPSGSFPPVQRPQGDKQSDPMQNWMSQWFSGLPQTQQFGGLNWLNSSPWWQGMSGNFGKK